MALRNGQAYECDLHEKRKQFGFIEALRPSESRPNIKPTVDDDRLNINADDWLNEEEATGLGRRKDRS